MGDVMGVVFIFLGLLLALPSYWLLSAGLWPGVVDRAEERFRARPLGTFGIGLLVAGGWILLAVLIGNLKVPKFPGPFIAGLISSLGIGWALTGVAGLAGHIGSRLPSKFDEGRRWRRILRGGIALELSMLIPLLGWLLVLPLALICGAGATMWALTAGRAEQKAPSPQPGFAPPAELPRSEMNPSPAGDPLAAAVR